jgi:NAD(P)-dependent dehydrogenase (short-subunit alcohol dehydrogenase family)
MSASLVSRNTNAAGELGELPAEMVPLRRMGDEQDMAGAILYLSSRAGAYCNGASLTVDGGRLGNFPSTG